VAVVNFRLSARSHDPGHLRLNPGEVQMNRDSWRTAACMAAAGLVFAAMTAPAMAASRWSWVLSRKSTANTAPSISGTPASSVKATTAYSFTPAASDAQNNALTFSITNKPRWASFSSSSGRLSGTPTTAQRGTYSNIVIRVSDGSLSSALPAFSITVTDAANTPPVISGVPASSVAAGTAYAFSPGATDADGNILAFAVTGKPSWATFSTATGSLAGTPGAGQAGNYPGIVITVSDGTASASLPAFGITVTGPVTGSATLTWSAPVRNADGSTLTDLAGYKVYHGTSASSLNESIQVAGAENTRYSFTGLARGTHYFAVSAYSSTGAESELSASGSKTIP
jgi:hypothetical protein